MTYAAPSSDVSLIVDDDVLFGSRYIGCSVGSYSGEDEDMRTCSRIRLVRFLSGTVAV